MLLKSTVCLCLVAASYASASQLATTSTSTSPRCLVVTDAAGQTLKLEAHGANAIRVRAVLQGGAFLDDPDVVSALVPQTDAHFRAAAGACPTVAHDAAPPSTLTQGNLKAAVGADGTLSFTRVSDGKTLLQEQYVRKVSCCCWWCFCCCCWWWWCRCCCWWWCCCCCCSPPLPPSVSSRRP